MKCKHPKFTRNPKPFQFSYLAVSLDPKSNLTSHSVGAQLLSPMEVLLHERLQGLCHDLNLELMTKVRAWKGAGRECNLRVTFTFLGMGKSVKE